MKRLDLILNGKGGVGKRYAGLLYILNQPTKTAVGRLTLCKPFLATAAVWLDSVARCCGSHLRFCFRKTCPAAGTKQLAIVEQGDKTALSQAEFNLFQVLDQALALYPDEAQTGKPELHRRCRICGAYLNECYC